MAWFDSRAPIRKPLFQRFLKLACLIVFLPLTIAALVVLGFLPMYLPNQNGSSMQSFDIPPLNVTYLLRDPSFLSSPGLNLNSINLEKMARSFESSLGINVQNVLQIKNISLNTAMGTNSKTRRKRLIQCEQDAGGLSGPVLVFDFNFTYPIHRLCQTQQCVVQVYNELYQLFRSTPSLSINFNDVIKDLRLCSAGVSSYTLEQTSTSTVMTTQQFTTGRSISTSNTPAHTNSTLSTTERSISTSNTLAHTNSTLSTTERPSSTSNTPERSNFTLNTNGKLDFTSNTNAGSNITLSTTERPYISSNTSEHPTATLNTTENPSFISNTSVGSNLTSVDMNACLNEFPMTQETVAPYEITYTSTLFFQDNHSILVIGASKFETKIDTQGIKRQLQINGVLVYTNCQRTIDVSLPITCHPSISA